MKNQNTESKQQNAPQLESLEGGDQLQGTEGNDWLETKMMNSDGLWEYETYDKGEKS
jgi:hypothetical protein